MRLFYSGWKGYTGQSVIRNIKKLGHEVRPWYYKDEHKFIGGRDRTKLITDKFVKDVEDYDPEIVFILKAGPLNPDGIDRIKKDGRIVVFFTLDDPSGYESKTLSYQTALKSDFVFTCCGNTKRKYESLGLKTEVIYIGFDPDFYCADEIYGHIKVWDVNWKQKGFKVIPYKEEDFKTDVLIIGHDYQRYEPSRVDIAKYLVKEKFSLKIYGWGWEKYPELKKVYRGSVHNTAIGKLYSHAKIIVCDFYSRKFENLNLRFFEIMGMGTLNICYRQEGIPDLFPEDKEVVYWSSLEELSQKCDYYLKHIEKRKKIAKAGQEHILSEYTTYHQMKKLFEFIKL